ncbi:MAG TPA: PH domain-containing protein [Edaphocola sp.]|nr:PH domain-containing protein [Edaphocola sp.]
MKYEASLDNFTKTISFLTILVIVISLIIVNTVIGDSAPSFLIPLYIILALSPILVFLWKPQYYLLIDNRLEIQRPIGKIIIPMNDILQFEQLSESVMKKSVRAFGSGGFFGYFGKFKNNQLGVMNWYATQRKNIVLIHLLKNKKILLTPDDLTGFLNNLAERMRA